MRWRSLATALVIMAAACIAPSADACAENYPDRPVRLIIGSAAGGTLDTLARLIAQKLTQEWGRSVVVENRPGGGGNIGATASTRSPPDGYTIHFGAQSLAVSVSIAPSHDFDPVKDFEPVILLATAQDVLMVPPDSAASTVQDLISYARARPGALNYASLGTGSSGHLATVLFSDLTGLKLQHVPYSSLSQAVTDIMAGRISLWIATLGGHLGTIQAGRVRALAVSGESRAAQLPSVPTFKEAGVPFVEESTWFGVFAPKRTPKDIVARINRDIGRILELPDMQERSATLGYRLVGGAPERLKTKLESEIVKWAQIARSASLTAH